MAGAEGVIRVHVPFSLTDLSSIEKRLGSFSTNPTNFIKEFQYLVQAYDLTWHDLHVILTSTMTPDEPDRVRTAARAHADQTHTTNPLMPVGAEAVCARGGTRLELPGRTDWPEALQPDGRMPDSRYAPVSPEDSQLR